MSIIIIVERVAANTRVITMFPIKAALQDDCPQIKWPFPYSFLGFWCRSPYSANNIRNTVLKISEFVILRVEEMHNIQHTIRGNPYLLICGFIWKNILIMSYICTCTSAGYGWNGAGLENPSRYQLGRTDTSYCVIVSLVTFACSVMQCWIIISFIKCNINRWANNICSVWNMQTFC